MPHYPIDEAQLVSMYMEAIAYGIYVVTFGMCMRALLWSRDGTKKLHNWPMIVFTMTMFIFATLDIAVALRHNLDAFISYKGPGGAQAEFEDISNWVNVVQVIPDNTSTCDAFILKSFA